MTESILDNQEVTAEILNNISIDLGGDDLSFTSVEKFGADKLNKITGDLVGAGILSGGSNHGGNCEVYTANNKIYVKSGIMVFADGRKKTIESDTEIGPLSDCCIYALNDTSTNTIRLIADTNFPASGDFVKLAHITNSIVFDERKTAVSKFNALGSRTPLEIKKTITATPNEPYEITLTNAPVGAIYGQMICGQRSMTFVYNAYYNKFGFLTNHKYDGINVGTPYVSFNILNNVLKITSSVPAELTLDMIAI